MLNKRTKTSMIYDVSEGVARDNKKYTHASGSDLKVMTDSKNMTLLGKEWNSKRGNT